MLPCSLIKFSRSGSSINLPPSYNSFKLIIKLGGRLRYVSDTGRSLKPHPLLFCTFVIMLEFEKKGWQIQEFSPASTGCGKSLVSLENDFEMLLRPNSFASISFWKLKSPILHTFFLFHSVRFNEWSMMSHQWSFVPIPYLLIHVILIASMKSVSLKKPSPPLSLLVKRRSLLIQLRLVSPLMKLSSCARIFLTIFSVASMYVKQ